MKTDVPYFFGYETVFSFQNNPKDLDPSCKMDLDLLDCLGRVKLELQQKGGSVNKAHFVTQPNLLITPHN